MKLATEAQRHRARNLKRKLVELFNLLCVSVAKTLIKVENSCACREADAEADDQRGALLECFVREHKACGRAGEISVVLQNLVRRSDFS